jgi:hypothetical protein
MQRKSTKGINALSRSAHVEASTFNEDERTIEVKFSTGAGVKREFFFGEGFIEELSLDEKHVRMERLKSGAPFLNNHRSGDLEDVIGVVENARIENGEGFATVRFSERESVQPIINDIRSGIIRNVSVGYRVHRFTELDEQRDGLKVLRATDWEPIEISAVPAGADPGAQFRSIDNVENDCLLVERVEEKQEETKEIVTEERSEQTLEEPKQTNNEVEMDKEKEVQLRKEAIEAEKKRQKEISHACRAAGMDDMIQNFIDEDKSIDEVRSLVIDKLAEKTEKVETKTEVPSVEVVRCEKETAREGMEEALLHRYDKSFEITEKGHKFAYRSLLEMAKDSLGLGNMPKQRIAERALHTTSDFALVLENVANKTLRRGYELAPRTWMPFVREVSVSDFKQISRVNLGEGSGLDKVLEHGEFTRGTMTESAEKYSVETFGKIIGITRQALINDDMSAFTLVPERMGRRARDLESDQIWSLIDSNPVMADGLAVFHASHGNLGTAGAPSETTLQEARQLMRLQVGLDGERISIVPRWMFVAPEDEVAAEKLIATIVPDSATNVNAFASSGRTPLQLAVEPRLSAGNNPWYVTASLDQIDMVELARLEGAEAPFIESREGFEVDGLEIKVRHDLGTAVIDHRGLVKNPRV